MSTFITKDDYAAKLRDYKLEQIIDGDDEILNDAEETAIAVVKDSLSAFYDLDAIFNTTGTDRPRNVLLWCKRLVLYYIYGRVDDELVPERVIKEYDETIETLKDIEDGKKQTTLPRIVDESGIVSTKFRWGSVPARSN